MRVWQFQKPSGLFLGFFEGETEEDARKRMCRHWEGEEGLSTARVVGEKRDRIACAMIFSLSAFSGLFLLSLIMSAEAPMGIMRQWDHCWFWMIFIPPLVGSWFGLSLPGFLLALMSFAWLDGKRDRRRQAEMDAAWKALQARRHSAKGSD